MDARTGAVVEADKWCANLQRQVHQFVNLLGEHFAQCTTEYGEVLAKDKNFAAVDGAPTSDDAVGVWVFFQTCCVCAVACKQIQFVKAALVEQNSNALAGQQLALFVLPFYRAWRTCVVGGLFAGLQVGQFVVHRGVTHPYDDSARCLRSPDAA